MHERKQFIEDWLAGGRCDQAGLGCTYGICRKTGHKWVQRFLAAGQPSRTNHTRARTARGAIRRRWTFVSSVHRPAGIQAALESARVSPIRSDRCVTHQVGLTTAAHSRRERSSSIGSNARNLSCKAFVLGSIPSSHQIGNIKWMICFGMNPKGRPRRRSGVSHRAGSGRLRSNRHQAAAKSRHPFQWCLDDRRYVSKRDQDLAIRGRESGPHQPPT